MKTKFYNYDEQAIFLQKIKENCSDYYISLWQGFINYYDKKTHKRIGYECIQAGYYLIIE